MTKLEEVQGYTAHWAGEEGDLLISGIDERDMTQEELDSVNQSVTVYTKKQVIDLLNNGNVNEKVIDWAKERGIDKPENATKQLLKGFEELSELGVGYNKLDREKMVDSMGDIQVVLIILAEQLGIDYTASLESAYKVIENRKGKTVNGVFIKEEDLK